MPYCIGTTFHELLHTLTVTPTLSTALLSRGGARARMSQPSREQQGGWHQLFEDVVEFSVLVP